MNHEQYEDRVVCLYWVNVQMRLSKGELEIKIFDDVDCVNCTPENHSGILCHHYMNRKHLEEFRILQSRL